jgi:hypothetical protein
MSSDPIDGQDGRGGPDGAPRDMSLSEGARRRIRRLARGSGVPARLPARTGASSTERRLGHRTEVPLGVLGRLPPDALRSASSVLFGCDVAYRVVTCWALPFGRVTIAGVQEWT